MERSLIKSIKQLKELAMSDEGIECFILLKSNLISRKTIHYFDDTNTFEVFNHIDESEQTLTPEQMNDESLTNIGKAIKLNALWTS